MAAIVRGLLLSPLVLTNDSGLYLEGFELNNHRGVLFTSESVTEGHPDKVADQISDAVLDAALSQDPMSRVACETMVTTGVAVVAGEITTKAIIDYQKVVRSTVESIGYTDASYGFDFKTCAVMACVDTQS